MPGIKNCKIFRHLPARQRSVISRNQQPRHAAVAVGKTLTPEIAEVNRHCVGAILKILGNIHDIIVSARRRWPPLETALANHQGSIDIQPVFRVRGQRQPAFGTRPRQRCPETIPTVAFTQSIGAGARGHHPLFIHKNMFHLLIHPSSLSTNRPHASRSWPGHPGRSSPAPRSRPAFPPAP